MQIIEKTSRNFFTRLYKTATKMGGVSSTPSLKPLEIEYLFKKCWNQTLLEGKELQQLNWKDSIRNEGKSIKNHME